MRRPRLRHLTPSADGRFHYPPPGRRKIEWRHHDFSKAIRMVGSGKAPRRRWGWVRKRLPIAKVGG